MPWGQEKLRDKMRELGIGEQDIRETFSRSSGPGGQNVNKVSTCVQLTHLPTGTTVRVSQERSQALNRFRARCLLIEKIARARREDSRERVAALEKRRRQNRKRPAHLKEKILEYKRHTSEKKKRRVPIRLNHSQDD
ncbi:MAG: peptide chain release factor-like protein [Candidatus Omnitrophota bacterium]